MPCIIEGNRGLTSPSVRRAWIEIHLYGEIRRKKDGSPSVRRAWIEISRPASGWKFWRVTLREEGVD